MKTIIEYDSLEGSTVYAAKKTAETLQEEMIQ